MYCFIAYDFQNEIGKCDEGELEWIAKDKILTLPLWEGDKYFIMNIINNKIYWFYIMIKIKLFHIK